MYTSVVCIISCAFILLPMILHFYNSCMTEIKKKTILTITVKPKPPYFVFTGRFLESFEYVPVFLQTSH